MPLPDRDGHKGSDAPYPLTTRIARFFRNVMGSRLSWRKSLARIAVNNWRKARFVSGCCGNNGQPGC